MGATSFSLAHGELTATSNLLALNVHSNPAPSTNPWQNSGVMIPSATTLCIGSS